MQCKSCRSAIETTAKQCPVCGIQNPQEMSSRKKKGWFIAAVAFVLLIIIVPMTAALLWMQNN